MHDEKQSDLIGNNPMFSPAAVNDKLTKMVESFQIPKWVLDGGRRTCQACGKPLAATSVREIGLCLNAQNIGDIQVEILCKECCSGYYLLFRKACKTASEFGEDMLSDFLREGVGEPVNGSSLKGSDNNLTEAMVQEVNRGDKG